jgi:hypothetical protein
MAGFRPGVEAQYAVNLCRFVVVTTQAKLFGVGGETSSLP